nr:hypothetical protein [uncultured Rhodopila sp.]
MALRYGFTTAKLYGASAATNPFHDAFRILSGENTADRLPQNKHPVLG